MGKSLESLFLSDYRQQSGPSIHPDMLALVELHIHTNNSDGISTTDEVRGRAQELGIKFAITNHDYSQPVFPGEVPGLEVSSGEGHLLVYRRGSSKPLEPVPTGLPVIETSGLLREQGVAGEILIFAAHPTQPSAHSMHEQKVHDLLASGDARTQLTGFEVNNASCDQLLGVLGRIRRMPQKVFEYFDSNRRARGMAERNPNVPLIGGSDAHYTDHIGGTLVGWNQEEDMWDAILARRAAIFTRLKHPKIAIGQYLHDLCIGTLRNKRNARFAGMREGV